MEGKKKDDQNEGLGQWFSFGQVLFFKLKKRWVYANKQLFENKTVHEIGSGCGLTGIIASLFAKEVVISDYKDPVRYLRY